MPVGWAVTVVVLCVAVIVLAVVVLGLLRQVVPLLERAAAADRAGSASQSQGPPVGRQVPDFTVRGPEREITAEQLRGQPAVLLFLSVGCGPCEQLAAQLRDAELGDLTSQLIVVTGPGGPVALKLPARLRVITEQAREVSDPLSVIGTPLGIALDRDGIVKAVRVTNTLEQLNGLAATASAETPYESAVHEHGGQHATGASTSSQVR
jgi:AhpC/TSA family